MAVSGSQKTRLGGSIFGVGIKQSFTAKAEGTAPTNTIMIFGRGIRRAMTRGFIR